MRTAARETHRRTIACTNTKLNSEQFRQRLLIQATMEEKKGQGEEDCVDERSVEVEENKDITSSFSKLFSME